MFDPIHSQVVKKANKSGQAYVVYQDDELQVIRADSTRIGNIALMELVGVYRASIKPENLRDDINSYFAERNERQARQSRILAEQMGVPGSS